jgi:hypothetical protein
MSVSVFAPLALLTALARTRGWPIARQLTLILSVLLAIGIPIGTLVFLYWFLRVRPRERALPA